MDRPAADIPLEDLLPHRTPMMLIDSVEEFSPEDRRVVVGVTIRRDSMFAGPDGVPAWVAIEYMAQASAALVGLYDHVCGSVPRPGLLLGTRRLELSAGSFAIGEKYKVSAVNAFEDAEAAAFECEIRNSTGTVMASASLNAYRPQDIAAFLKEHGAR